MIPSPRYYERWQDVQIRGVGRVLQLPAPYQPDERAALPASPLLNSPSSESLAQQTITG